MYKLGYCMAAIEELNIDRYSWLYELKKQCEKLMLDIPDEWIMARSFGDRPYSSAEYRDFYWLNRKSQKRSYNWDAFNAMLKEYPLA